MRLQSVAYTAALLGALAGAAQAQDGSVSLTTSYPFYEVGETVSFTLTNNTSGGLEMGVTPYVIKRGSQTVYAPISILVVSTLGPGQSRTWTWRQIDNAGNPVTPGLYQVVLQYWQPGGQMLTRSAAFEIVRKTFGSVVFRTTRTTYRTGAPVKFFIINKGQQSVSLPSSAPWTIDRRTSSLGWELVYAPIHVAVGQKGRNMVGLGRSLPTLGTRYVSLVRTVR
jgi:hypothetical protein